MDCRLHARAVGLHEKRKSRLADFTLCAGAGEVIGLFGANGAGKSTALAILAGCLPPRSGEVRLDDRPLYSPDLGVRRRIGYLPQQSPVYPDLSVAENLAFAARLHGVTPGAIGAALEIQYERLELAPFRHRLGVELSAGMARRTALGMSLVHDPDFILLDEPTAGLDPAQAERLRQLLRALAPGRVIVLSSHLAADIEQTCCRALLLQEGHLVEEENIRGDRVHALVEFSRPPEDAELLALDGVLAVLPPVSPLAPRQRILQLAGDSGADWPELLANRAWGLRRFEPRRSRLACHAAASGGEEAA